MTMRLSSFAAIVVTFASLALAGCAADAEEPVADDAASSAEPTTELESGAGSLEPKGFTFVTTYYSCTSDGRVASSTSPTLDAFGWSYDRDHRTAGGVCVVL